MALSSKSYRETDMIPRCYNQVSNNLKDNSAYIHEIIKKLLIMKYIFQGGMQINMKPFRFKRLKFTKITPTVLVSLFNIYIYLHFTNCNNIPSVSI